MHKKFLLENLEGRDRVEDIIVDQRVMLKWILEKWGVRVWTASKIGTSDGLL
jgi:hypothetical protein